MDEDLKQFLTQMETRLSRHILHEMSLRFIEMDAKLNSMDERLKLQTDLIQGGAQAMARFSSLAENAEKRWVD